MVPVIREIFCWSLVIINLIHGNINEVTNYLQLSKVWGEKKIKVEKRITTGVSFFVLEMRELMNQERYQPHIPVTLPTQESTIIIH